MPRYFFHTADGTIHRDDEGSVFRDLAEAKNEAVRMFGDIVRQCPAEVVKDGHFHLCVSDEAGLHLFEVTLITTPAPASFGTNPVTDHS